ncbi:MAG: hydrogenase formation protein HypD [Endomicrobium sp.]|nr:hydrogenase formation protein HypD [Endomicrobium sp.]
MPAEESKKTTRQSYRLSKGIKIMEVCGTHTMTIARYGLRDYFVGTELISGPGCPVCVTPSNRLEQCLHLLKNKNIVIATFGDMLRVPAFTSSLELEILKGADVRVIYCVYDPLKIAEANPEKEVVFIGAGFETTLPAAAAVIKEAYEKKIKNISVFSMFKSIFPALNMLVSDDDFDINGFILPGNVAAIAGAGAFRYVAEKYKISCAVTGFSKKEIVEAIDFLIKNIKSRSCGFKNIYKAVVNEEGNIKAKNLISEVFDLKDDIWRGLGCIKKSGFRLNKKYATFDADIKFQVKDEKDMNKKEPCRCGDIMRGKINPYGCGFFGKKCTPLKPLGPCMVSSEGVCSAYYKYGKYDG